MPVKKLPVPWLHIDIRAFSRNDYAPCFPLFQGMKHILIPAQLPFPRVGPAEPGNHILSGMKAGSPICALATGVIECVWKASAAVD